jgi:biopolymer transport protein ExbD
MRRRPPTDCTIELDLVPLVDCVFLILLFFILCGRLTIDGQAEQVTVPPARSAHIRPLATERIVINLKAGERPAIRIVGGGDWIDLSGGWVPVRQRLDAIWNAAGKRPGDGHQIADVVLEVRADEELPYRLVQELQQIAADAVDPETMIPGRAVQRSFVNIDFAVVTPS